MILSTLFTSIHLAVKGQKNIRTGTLKHDNLSPSAHANNIIYIDSHWSDFKLNWPNVEIIQGMYVHAHLLLLYGFISDMSMDLCCAL